jgi:hypothetical protein
MQDRKTNINIFLLCFRFMRIKDLSERWKEEEEEEMVRNVASISPFFENKKRMKNSSLKQNYKEYSKRRKNSEKRRCESGSSTNIFSTLLDLPGVIKTPADIAQGFIETCKPPQHGKVQFYREPKWWDMHTRYKNFYFKLCGEQYNISHVGLLLRHQTSKKHNKCTKVTR